ncbi:DUF4302 domain-containing protein [Flavobacterium poyangense]|uniref:DUF4302 domain-containing protein n=1 Tax=Flavobacterium poyangense TaxID=2204302 RepID=UPI001FBAC799|nr:DUF4302 domain-containing protein [Flavobacterium sp. JXAS1]
MMKEKNIFNYLVVVLLTLQLVACTRTDAEQKFNQTPTERLVTQQKELNDLLLSSEYGWKAIYFTDSTQLGGFTHLFKFLPDGKVDMASDFDTKTAVQSSQYEIQLGSTVSLVFTTANRIHLLSDSDSYPSSNLRGKGYLGDFQFLYNRQEKGDIVFSTNRKVQELRFVKATAEDWTDLNKSAITLNNMNGDIKSPLFKRLVTNDGTAEHDFNFDFNSSARFGIATPLDPTNTESYNFGFSYTPTGAIAKPALIVKGQKLTNFLYDSTTNSFVAKGTGNVSASIKRTNVPPVLTDDYKALLTATGNKKSTFVYYSETMNTSNKNSGFYKNLFDKANATLPDGKKIRGIWFNFNTANKKDYIEYEFNGSKQSIKHYITTSEDAVNKTIIFKDVSWSVAEKEYSFLKDLDAELTNPKGLYCKKEDYIIHLTNYVVFTFTSAANPLRMTLYKTE